MTIKAGMSILVAALLALAAATPASASIHREFDIDETTPSKAWTGDPLTAFSGWTGFSSDDPSTCEQYGVAPLDACEETLVHLTGDGTLDVALPDAGDGVTNEWDLAVYEADGAGAPGGLIGESYAIGGAESVSFEATTGHYLVVAVPYQAVEGSYSGTVTFTPPPAEEEIEE